MNPAGDWCATMKEVEKTAVRRYRERIVFEDAEQDAGNSVDRYSTERCEILTAEFSADRDAVVAMLNAGGASGDTWKVMIEGVVCPKLTATARFRDGGLIVRQVEQPTKEKTDADTKPEAGQENAGTGGVAGGVVQPIAGAVFASAEPVADTGGQAAGEAEATAEQSGETRAHDRRQRKRS